MQCQPTALPRRNSANAKLLQPGTAGVAAGAAVLDVPALAPLPG